MTHKYGMDFRIWLEAFAGGIPSRFINNGVVTLYHYTHLKPNQRGNLKLIPSQASKNFNPYSTREYKTAGFPRIFYYIDPENVHQDVGGISTDFLYKVEMPVGNIYPMEEDPNGIKSQVDPWNFDTYMSLLKKAGYKGGYYNTGNLDIVILWVPATGTIVPREQEEDDDDWDEEAGDWKSNLKNL